MLLQLLVTYCAAHDLFIPFFVYGQRRCDGQKKGICNATVSTNLFENVRNDDCPRHNCMFYSCSTPYLCCSWLEGASQPFDMQRCSKKVTTHLPIHPFEQVFSLPLMPLLMGIWPLACLSFFNLFDYKMKMGRWWYESCLSIFTRPGDFQSWAFYL